MGNPLSSIAGGGSGSGGGGGGTGDVIGPAAATDNALARFDTTTGKLLQDGLVTETDTGNLLLVNGTKAAPALACASDPTTGPYRRNAGGWTFSSSGTAVIEIQGTSGLMLNDTMALRWGNGAVDAVGADTGVSRSAAGEVAIGTGSAGGFTGLLKFGGARCRGFTTTAAAATTTEYPTDKDWGVHLNSNTGAVHLIFNNAGAIKSVQLT